MRLLHLILICLLLFSCKAIKTVRMIKSESVSLQNWKNANGKTVVFLSMVHVGQSEFYNKVNDSINAFKNKGFVVFYEGLKKDSRVSNIIAPEDITRYKKFPEVTTQNPDSLTRLIYLLKIRRMVGVIPDSSSYMNLIGSVPFIKNAVMQPSWFKPGITTNDQNVDLSYTDIVDEYENRHGKITLQQIDFAVPLNEPIPGSLRLKKSRVFDVIIRHRNENLARTIHETNNYQILVLYGADHRKGALEQLSKLDGSWKVSK
jgi:hypothetical protein